ncbi:MAG: permease-like cell division protein FtsX [Butyricicoccaceae bacterium]
MNLFYHIRQAFSNLRLNRFMSFAAVSVMTICMLLTCTLTLLTLSIDNELRTLQEENEIDIYIDKSVSQKKALAMEQTLLAIDNVESVTFVSKEQALEAYRARLGENGDILTEGWEKAEENPLRDSYIIHVKDIRLLDDTSEEIAKIKGVANVQASSEVAALLVRLRDTFRTTAMVMVVALGFVSLFIISNVVRLGMMARKDEIAIQKMVGATNHFVRMPFVIEGFVIGCLGAVIAFPLQWLLFDKLSSAIGSMVSGFAMLNFMEIWPLVIGAFLAAGIAVGVVGSWITIRRFLKV